MLHDFLNLRHVISYRFCIENSLNKVNTKFRFLADYAVEKVLPVIRSLPHAGVARAVGGRAIV